MSNAGTVDAVLAVSAGRLPSLPGVAFEVIRLAQEEEVDLDKIAATVGRDPMLAGRLLKLSNSPLFGRTLGVASINQALMLLGLKTVKMATISFSVGAALGGVSVGDGRDQEFRGFWRRSVTSAVAAHQLVGSSRPDLADEAFLCGLLQDIGFATMLHCGSSFEAIDAGHPDVAAEQAGVDGFTHADVSAQVLESWGLPAILSQPIQHHHDPDGLAEDASEEVTLLARTLNLAHDVATIVTSASSRGAALQAARDKAAQWCGMDADAFDAFLAGLTEHVHDMAGLMGVDVGSREDMASMMGRAQEDMRAMAVGPPRELDPTLRLLEELRTKAETDALTGIRNRAAFDELVTEHWEQRASGATRTPIGLIMSDVDKFKAVNDTFGHQVGDEILKHVAKTLEGASRSGSDIVCRYGGEEFVVIAPGASYEELEAISERLRVAVAEMTVPTAGDGGLSVTASFGAAWVEYIPQGMAADHLLAVADRNLYLAKEAGRDRCVVTEFS